MTACPCAGRFFDISCQGGNQRQVIAACRRSGHPDDERHRCDDRSHPAPCPGSSLPLTPMGCARRSPLATLPGTSVSVGLPCLPHGPCATCRSSTRRTGPAGGLISTAQPSLSPPHRGPRDLDKSCHAHTCTASICAPTCPSGPSPGRLRRCPGQNSSCQQGGQACRWQAHGWRLPSPAMPGPCCS